MVAFVAKNLPVDNSDLYELDGYKPLNPVGLSTSIESKYKNGVLTVKVTQDGALKYKIAKIEVSRNEANKLFKGDFEPKLFKGGDEIKGSTQADSLFGFNGDDLIRGRDGDDAIYGGKGNDSIFGDTGGDTIDGGKGNDAINGGIGVNPVTGGSGKDKFVFDTELAPGSYAYITDFTHGDDKMQLDKGVFSGIGRTGQLSASKFFLLDDYDGAKNSVIYDKATGIMAYSKLGGDASNAVAFGGVVTGLDLSNKDFLIA